ncbi:MAG: hypothetical protein IPM17_16765 [Verrucomicrobia bacterium]|nr:hypothetical protein [Verrucomicrobiota bacterium]
MRRQTSIVGTALLLTVALTSARAGKLEIYPAPPSVPASDRFKVEVREKSRSTWQPVFVHQSVSSLDSKRDASWASFSFSGRVELRVTPLQTACRTVVVRPKAFDVPATLVQGQVIIPLNRPRKLAIEINGDADHPLFIFADRPDRPPVKEPGRELVVFEPGLHDIGDRYPLRSHTTYYLRGGAVLRGSFYGTGRLEDVTIRGRGLIDSGHQAWQHPTKGLRSNIAFEDGHNIRIEGITCIGAGNFQIKVQSKQPGSRITIENVKLIGWSPNTDGIHVSDMDWKDHPRVGNAPGVRLRVRDCFIRANDDAVLLSDGVWKSEVKDCVFWDDGGGATFCLSWGGHQPVKSSRVERCHVIHKLGPHPVFRARHAGEALIRNVRFRNITVEGDIQSLVNLRIMPHRYDPDPSHGAIEDIVFRDITVEGRAPDNVLEGLSEEFPIRRVTFRNVRVAGKLVRNPADLNLRTNEFLSGVRFVP